MAAVYLLRINNVTVDNPRAPQNDTLLGEATALYMGELLPNPNPISPFDPASKPRNQTQVFGDRGSGSVLPTTFSFGPFRGVPGVAPSLTFNYAFINRGYDHSKEEALLKVLNVLSEAGQAAATLVMPQGSGAWDKINDIHQKINGGLLSGCDGLVAADQIVMNSDVLDVITKGNNVYSENRAYEGTSSPVVCGKVSHYRVNFSVYRISSR